MTSKILFRARINTFNKFSSGNQMEMGRGRMYRSKSYHGYHDELWTNIMDVLDDMGDIVIPNDKALRVKLCFGYPVPKSLVKTKAQRALFSDNLLLPITRGTMDLDNTTKGASDAIMDVLGYDDSQVCEYVLMKRYIGSDEDYQLDIQIEEMDGGQEIEWVDEF